MNSVHASTMVTDCLSYNTARIVNSQYLPSAKPGTKQVVPFSSIASFCNFLYQHSQSRCNLCHSKDVLRNSTADLSQRQFY